MFFSQTLSRLGRINKSYSKFEGAIDMIADGRVHGWIRRKGENTAVVIDCYLDGNRIAQGVQADIWRQDVQQAGLGDGKCGFEITLPAGVQSGAASLQVRSSGDEKVLLQRIFKNVLPVETVALVPQVALVPTTSLGPLLDYECKIERLTTDSLRGWATQRSAPSEILEIGVYIDGSEYCRTFTNRRRDDLKKLGKSFGYGGISLDLPLEWLEAGSHEVALKLPDGTRIARMVEVKEQRNKPRPLTAISDPVAIIIPVYNAADDLENCIERLAAYTPTGTDILFIDDASPDPRISMILDHAAKQPGMRILRNPENIGFTRTVNRGLAETAPRDVIILNSDARVTPGWVEGLQTAARSSPRVATVTPMSDRAGAFSAPKIGNENPLPPGVDEVTYARAFRRRSLGLYPPVPTGNGFCMWIRRACLEEVGDLDAEAFPRGYGEENDFCMRAGRAGWRHVLDDRTYVFHDRNKSFGETKEKLLTTGRAVIDSRWPEYSKVISVFRNGSAINLARLRAHQALADCSEPSARARRILYVLSTETGGTPQTNRDLMRALDNSVDAWVLRSDGQQLQLSRFDGSTLKPTRSHILSEPVDPITHASAEYDMVVAEWLEALDVDLVHIRHLAWHGISLPAIIRAAGLPVVVSFHDYYTLCPTVNLMDENNSFCGGKCTTSPGDCQAELWPADVFPRLKDTWVPVWRERFGRVLAECDAFVTTSEFTRARLLEHHPELPADRFHVIPHGRDFTTLPRLRQSPEAGAPIRILVPGNINPAKGLDILHAVLAEDRNEEIEFHILGNIKQGVYPDHPRLIAHGSYTRDGFAARVTLIGPQIGAVFSIWDETWCHTLTELWSVGLPVAVFDFPTVANRVRASGAGWVLDHHDIPKLTRDLVRLARDRDEILRTDAALSVWKEGTALADSTWRMAADYLDVYRMSTMRRHGGPNDNKGRTEGIKATVAASPRHRPRVAVVCPAEPSLTRANASTEIRIWERTHNTLDRGVNYVRMGPDALLASLRSGSIDSAIVQRDVVPAALVDPLLRALQETKTPWQLDLDDDLLSVPRDKDPEGRYAAYAPFLKQLLASATAVTVSTEPLRAVLEPLARRVELLPNRLSLRLWGEGAVAARSSDGTIRAVYMGTVTHAGDLALITPALNEFARAEPRFRLSVIGVTQGELPSWAARLPIPPDAHAYHKFVPWLRAQAKDFDFALAPLEATDFNSCKSTLKALDAGALGLPVVASDHPVYRQAVANAPGVRLVPDGTQAWMAALLAQASVGRDGGSELRDWVFANHAMEPTLDAFDERMIKLIKVELETSPYLV